MVNLKSIMIAQDIIQKVAEKTDIKGYSLLVNGTSIQPEWFAMVFSKKSDIKHPIFLEHTIRDNGLYIWLWSPDHEQYQWIKENTQSKYDDGIFLIHNDDSMEYLGSLYDYEI